MRVTKGGTVETDAVLHFTETSLTVANAVVAPDPIDQDSRWAQRPNRYNHATDAPPLVSMFAPPRTTRESFGERLMKSPMYLYVGEELYWPSSMSSEDGAVLTLGVDGSLLFKNQAAAAAPAFMEAESDLVVQPLVTLIAADFDEGNRVLKKRLTGGGKAVDADLLGRKDSLKVAGGAGRDAGGRTVLTVTDEGDVVSGCVRRAGDRQQLSNVTVSIFSAEFISRAPASVGGLYRCYVHPSQNEASKTFLLDSIHAAVDVFYRQACFQTL